MVKNIITGISLIIFSLMFTNISSGKIEPETIEGAWLFDEGSGDTVEDISENGNDGKLVGEPKWVSGKFSQALDFDGQDDYVEVADSESLDITGTITMAAWMYKRSDAVHGGTILGKWYQDQSTWSYVLYGLGDGGGGFRLRWSDDSQTNLEGPYQLPNEEWVHYTATYDGSIMRVFQNGEEIASTPAEKQIKVTDIPVWIGNDGYQQHFNGILDEVAIFNVALTVDEINDLMENGLSSVSPVFPLGKVAYTWGNIKADY